MHARAKAKAALEWRSQQLSAECWSEWESESVFIFYANARVCDSFEAGVASVCVCAGNRGPQRNAGSGDARHTCGRRFLNLFSAVCASHCCVVVTKAFIRQDSTRNALSRINSNLFLECAFYYDAVGPRIGYFLNSRVPPVKSVLTMPFVTGGAIDKYSNEQRRRALGAGAVTHLVGFIRRSIETLRWNVNFSTVSRSLGVCYLERHQRRARSIFYCSRAWIF